MSVLARKRSLSKLEFYKNAVKLRKQMVFLLLRDLGIKNRVRNMQITTKNMEPQDAETVQAIAERYGLIPAVDEYPEWIIDRLRGNIWDLLSSMLYNITQAYTVWATNKAEAEQRRCAQNRAIADCESLLKELELAIEVLPINAEKYMKYVDAIDREIALLKGWRKSDNKRLKELS